MTFNFRERRRRRVEYRPAFTDAGRVGREVRPVEDAGMHDRFAIRFRESNAGNGEANRNGRHE
jgi:hypothetical protein